MRTNFFSIATLVIVILATPSCIENSSKYKTLQIQRDSIANEHQNLELDYHNTLDMLNEVETGFAMIREVEGRIVVDVNTLENNNKAGKILIADQFAQLKDILEDNKQKINQLQRFSNLKGKENTALQTTIQRLENELADRIALADSLQKIIAKKNIQIESLTADLVQVKSDLKDINVLSAQQQDMIKSQDADLNEVWYVVDKLANLKANAIVSSNGLFKAKTLLDKSFDKSALTQADLRELKTIPTDSKNVKILSSHPEDSYELVKDDEKFISIEIINPTQFWSITKYLVVRKR